MTSTVLLVMAIKRDNGNSSVGVYFPHDSERWSDELSDAEYLSYYGVARYAGTVNEKLAMLERDLKALENRIGKTNAS